MIATIEIPMPLPSLSNGRGHSRERGRIVKRQRETVMRALMVPWSLALGDACLTLAPLTITLVRVAPRGLDDDNLRGALKASRDSVTAWLGHTDDAHPHLRWMYGQAVDEQRRAKYQAARVTIVIGHHDCAVCGQSLARPEKLSR